MENMVGNNYGLLNPLTMRFEAADNGCGLFNPLTVRFEVEMMYNMLYPNVSFGSSVTSRFARNQLHKKFAHCSWMCHQGRNLPGSKL